ncbi:Alpha/Beta hydrolase protein [Hyaloraphidium curvatum]|nr:Alpha/Beta hydrolase protein [Hyaloraphidium curvatum]
MLPVRFSRTPSLFPLPPGIARTILATRSGALELLSAPASPSAAVSPRPHVLFVHGGFGFPGVWVPWMSALAAAGYASRAVGLRGHGASWGPPYLKMWMGTTANMLAEDVAAAAKDAEAAEGSPPVLVGHSSGGGLVQWVLGNGMARAKAMVLVGAVPHFGSMGVYRNWFRLDPWFMTRSLLHLQHPRSPLSSTRLVKAAFFGPTFPDAEVREFERWMPEYESLAWPLAMMRPFVSAGEVVASIEPTPEGVDADRVMILSGTLDRLMDPPIQLRAAEEYRLALGGAGAPFDDKLPAQGWRVQRRGGVSYGLVAGAGHHVQNDLQKEEGAEALLQFLDRL